MSKKTSSFDPRDFGFRCFKLRNETLHFFERDIGFDNADPDMNRLNTYLSQDGEFVTIWWGLFDPFITEAEFKGKAPEILNFQDQYNNDLFRGFIQNNEQAEVILKAIRYDKLKPQHIFIDGKNGLMCDFLLPDK